MDKRIAAKVGEYEKNGETKGDYVRLGVILSNDNGEYMLLDPTVNLSGVLQKQNRYNHSKGKKTGDMVMCSIFDDNNQQQAPQPQQGSGANNSFDDDPGF